MVDSQLISAARMNIEIHMLKKILNSSKALFSHLQNWYNNGNFDSTEIS